MRPGLAQPQIYFPRKMESQLSGPDQQMALICLYWPGQLVPEMS